ncbi:hypothetical protein OC861_006952, partial [Tilletia horrida]
MGNLRLDDRLAVFAFTFSHCLKGIQRFFEAVSVCDQSLDIDLAARDQRDGGRVRAE